jgi:hypothetical protein
MSENTGNINAKSDGSVDNASHVANVIRSEAL